MIADKMERTKRHGQNGIGQNGTDKMARTEWYRQNGNNFLNRI